MIKAIFWDNDGVLVDTEELYYRATIQVLKDSGFFLSRSDYIDICLRNGGSAFEIIKGQGLSKEQLRQQRNDLYASYLREDSVLNHGVAEVLRALKSKYKMAIITSSRKVHFDIIHRSTKILDCFDFILTREDYTCAKPHPEPYLLALAKSGFSKEQCIIVEDSERGLRAARAAGMGCYIIPNGLTRDGDFRGAVKVLKNVECLIDELVC